MEDETGFDREWDIKDENGMNVTENKLLEAMEKIGLNPESQYRISQMTVDFAFPEEKLVIEVNGPYHETEKQKLADKKRWFVLNSHGWKRKTFSAKRVYYHPDQVAEEIRKLVGKDKEESFSLERETSYSNYNENMTFEPVYPEATGRYTSSDLIFSKRRSNKWIYWVIVFIIIFAVVAYLIVSNTDNLRIQGNQQVSNNQQKIVQTPEVKPVIVEGSKTDVIIQNNQPKSISVNVTYRIYSDFFGIDSQRNGLFEVGANNKQSFKVYDNVGCDIAACSVQIIDFTYS